MIAADDHQAAAGGDPEVEALLGSNGRSRVDLLSLRLWQPTGVGRGQRIGLRVVDRLLPLGGQVRARELAVDLAPELA